MYQAENTFYKISSWKLRINPASNRGQGLLHCRETEAAAFTFIQNKLQASQNCNPSSDLFLSPHKPDNSPLPQADYRLWRDVMLTACSSS